MMTITTHGEGKDVIYDGKPGTIFVNRDYDVATCYNPKTGDREPGYVKVIHIVILNSEPAKSCYVHSAIRKRS